MPALLLVGACEVSGPASCGPPPTTSVAVRGAVALSASDMWIVGQYQHLGPAVPLAEHWDGSSWRSVVVPVGSFDQSAYFNAVVGGSSSDVWAVGAGQYMGSEGQTLIERWDGSRWSIVPSPNAGGRLNQLAAIAELSPSDAWAVGDYYSDDGRDLVLTEHWDGRSWTIVPGADPSPGMNELSGVAAVAPDDVWAVGWLRDSNASKPQTLIEHWDGLRWSVVSSPSPGGTATLTNLYAIDRADIWAVGGYDTGNTFAPLVERWDGTGWHVFAAPYASNAAVESIIAAGPNNVWLAGEYGDGRGANWLVARWDGSRWSRIDAGADATGTANALFAQNGGVWAAGVYRSNSCGPDWALIKRWNGQSWEYVQSPHDGRSGGT